MVDRIRQVIEAEAVRIVYWLITSVFVALLGWGIWVTEKSRCVTVCQADIAKNNLRDDMQDDLFDARFRATLAILDVVSSIAENTPGAKGIDPVVRKEFLDSMKIKRIR